MHIQDQPTLNHRDSTVSFHLQANSYAKVNLFLRVGDLETTGGAIAGYHPLVSWMTTVGLADTLRIRLQGPASPDKAIVIDCDMPGIPTDHTNIIHKAISLYQSVDRSTAGGVYVQLSKKIPAGGGLGGGSSNAAAMLLAMRNVSGDAEPRQLADMAQQLGSDVPFFLNPPSCLAQGRGEVLTPVSPPANAPWAVLMFPRGIAVNTAACYRRLDVTRAKAPPDTLELPDCARLAAMSVDELLAVLVNDLEPPAFSLVPELGELRQRLQSAARRVVRMSGSGSTLFTLASGPDDASEIASRIQSEIKHLPVSVSLSICELARHRNGVASLDDAFVPGVSRHGGLS